MRSSHFSLTVLVLLSSIIWSCDDTESNSDAGRDPLNPPAGETSTITARADGYETFYQNVTLPYECHPRATVDVQLNPI